MDREINATNAAVSQILSDNYSGCVALGQYFVKQVGESGHYIELLGLVGICNAFVQAVLVRRLVPRIGERRAIGIGLACGIAGFAWMGLAPSGAWFLGSVPLMALWGLAGPATQSLVTQRVDPAMQGRLQGSLSSLVSVAGIFGPFLFTAIFRAFIGEHRGWELPGAAFLAAAVLLGVAWAVAHRATRPLPA